MTRTILSLVTVCSFLLCCICSYAATPEVIPAKGYNAIAGLDSGFIAVGSDGRIDRIAKTGEIISSEKQSGVNFLCLLVYGQTVVAGGDEGNLFVSSENKPFRKWASDTDKPIRSIALFNDKIIAGSDQGELFVETDKASFHKITLALKGNIVSLSARTSECYGVTDQGEIIHSKDGIHWEIFNFNEFYAGYYQPCAFTRVLATDNRIAVTGKKSDGSPVLLFSTQGNVWTDRKLDYADDHGQMYALTDIPNSMYYYYPEDQFILVCDGGKMMTIPSCSHCNKLIPVTAEDLCDISCNNGILMIAGSNYFLKAINMGW